MKVKHIDPTTFGRCFLNSHKVRQSLGGIALAEFGCINCPITTIYCLYNPSQLLRQQLVQHLQLTFGTADLHFEPLNSSDDLNITQLT